MSDQSGGEGWWQASDGKWYPPEQHPGYPAGATQPMAAAEPPPTTAMPPVPPPGGPVPPPPGGLAGPPPGGPAASSSNAKWIIVGALAVAAIAVAAFLLTRDDGKKDNVAATSSSSPSSSSTSSSSSSRSSSSSTRSTSSSSRSSSSSSSAPTAAELQPRLLTASDVDPTFQDETFTPDDTSPLPCGQPNTATRFPPVVDVGSSMSNATGDLFLQEEVMVYKDATTGSQAFDAAKEGVSCSQGSVGSESQTVTFSPARDVSSDFGVPEGIEIDFVAGDIQGQLFAMRAAETIVTFQFAGSSSADTSNLPSPDDIVRNGLTKLSS